MQPRQLLASSFLEARRIVMTGRLGASPFWRLLEAPFPSRDAARFLNCKKAQVKGAFDELLRDREFQQHLDSVLPLCRGCIAALPLLYVFCRILRPQRVLETGVASGISSAFILLALERNQSGLLASIDLPNYDDTWVQRMLSERGNVPNRPYVDNSIPPGEASGWAIPGGIRGRWELTLADTKLVLPEFLARIDTIDLALHDSDHSPQVVFRECSMLWNKLRPGGVLLVDDIDLGDGFTKLVENLDWKAKLIVGRLGALRR